jgi:hypothetical protein
MLSVPRGYRRIREWEFSSEVVTQLSLVKRTRIQRHTAVQLSVGHTHGKFVVEEELEVDL